VAHEHSEPCASLCRGQVALSPTSRSESRTSCSRSPCGIVREDEVACSHNHMTPVVHVRKAGPRRGSWRAPRAGGCAERRRRPRPIGAASERSWGHSRGGARRGLRRAPGRARPRRRTADGRRGRAGEHGAGGGRCAEAGAGGVRGRGGGRGVRRPRSRRAAGAGGRRSGGLCGRRAGGHAPSSGSPSRMGRLQGSMWSSIRNGCWGSRWWCWRSDAPDHGSRARPRHAGMN
jgi:hypothetical protein